MEKAQEQNEWITKVRLAIYKGLSIKPVLDNNEKEMQRILKQLLSQDGWSEETLDREISLYRALSDEERLKLLEEKAEALASQIGTYLENNEEISSKDYPELYHRIQELLVLDPSRANEVIKKTLERKKISHSESCGASLFGIPCTYYFSKKISYVLTPNK